MNYKGDSYMLIQKTQQITQKNIKGIMFHDKHQDIALLQW